MPTSARVAEALVSWRMFPRTQPEHAVQLARLAIGGLDAENRDWLVFSLKDSAPLPAKPLRLRHEPVAIGDTVYLSRRCRATSFSEPAVRTWDRSSTLWPRYAERFPSSEVAARQRPHS
jgi:hypothetical protein